MAKKNELHGSHGAPLDPLPCPKCGADMEGCWDWNEKQQALRLAHWYCSNCSHDTKAIGRERLVKFADWQEDKK